MKLHSFGPAFGLIDASPFVTKVKLFMALHSISYSEITDVDKLAKAPKKKFPYIEDGPNIIADSNAILKYLSKKHDIDMDSWLNAEQLAIAHLVSKSLEENLYWCLVHSRWVNSDTWPQVKKHFFGAMPFPLNHIISSIARKGTIKRINGHGMGSHSTDEILEIAIQSFDSLSTLLGDKEFFFGDNISSLDLVAFSQLSSFTLASIDNRMTEACRERTNLVSFTNRIQAAYLI